MQGTKRKTSVDVVSICGYSNVGKTTLFCKIFVELEKRGFRVLPIKHHGHVECNPYKVEIEWQEQHTNKVVDTMCYRNAGAKEVVLITGQVDQEQWNDIVKRLVKLFPHKNLLLVEGLKKLDIPKVEIIANHTVPVGNNHITVVSNVEGKDYLNRNNSNEIMNQILEFLKGVNHDRT